MRVADLTLNTVVQTGAGYRLVSSLTLSDIVQTQQSGGIPVSRPVFQKPIQPAYRKPGTRKTLMDRVRGLLNGRR